MYPIKQNGIQEKFLKFTMMVAAVAAIATISMTNANSVMSYNADVNASHVPKSSKWRLLRSSSRGMLVIRDGGS
jgi:hypothetical protein